MTRYTLHHGTGTVPGFTSATEACLYAIEAGLTGWTWKVEGRA